jgi:hypothetical protein
MTKYFRRGGGGEKICGAGMLPFHCITILGSGWPTHNGATFTRQRGNRGNIVQM